MAVHGTYVLTQKEFDALPEYSCSIPTGQSIGKEWKRKNNYYDSSKGWILGEYVEHSDPEKFGIAWANIEIEEKINNH